MCNEDLLNKLLLAYSIVQWAIGSIHFLICTSGMDWTVSPQKIWGSPHSNYLRTLLCLERVVAGVISLDEVGAG